MTSSTLDSMAGRSLHFKCELFQKTGSFKVSSWLYGRLSDGMFHFFPEPHPPYGWADFYHLTVLSEPCEKTFPTPPHFLLVPFKTDFYKLSARDTHPEGGVGIKMECTSRSTDRYQIWQLPLIFKSVLYTKGKCHAVFTIIITVITVLLLYAISTFRLWGRNVWRTPRNVCVGG